jgi:hypothetical protein
MSLKSLMEKLDSAMVAKANLANVDENEQGTLAALATLAIANEGKTGSQWRTAIEEWQPATSDMLALKDAALQFLSSEWAERAVDLGWGEVDLFGLFPNAQAARYRYGTWGLVTHLGLSIHKPQLILISEDCATVRTMGGATHTKPRVLPEEKISRPFWECGTV